MGKTRTFTYRLEFRCVSGAHYTPQEWRVRSHRLYGQGFGAPTTANIDKWVTGFENSMKPGQPNAHLGQDQVTVAQVVDQRDGKIVAVWFRRNERKNQPLFEVIS